MHHKSIVVGYVAAQRSVSAGIAIRTLLRRVQHFLQSRDSNPVYDELMRWYRKGHVVHVA